MTRYCFVDALPVAGAASPLLVTAVGHRAPMRLSELARETGISKFSASRAADSLAQQGFLTREEDGVLFNDSHPLADEIIRLAWLYSGVRRPPRDDGRMPSLALPGWSQIPYRYQPLVPVELHARAVLSDTDRRGPAGPVLLNARETCNWLAKTSRLLHTVEAQFQEVFALWRDERARDLIHRALDLGSGVDEAWQQLSVACGAEAQGEQSPFVATVSGYIWTRCTFLVAAELHELWSILTMLNTAVRNGSRVNRLRSKALSDLLWGHKEERTLLIEEGLQDADAATTLWNDQDQQPWHHMGGTPSPMEVGTLGDKLLAVQLLDMTTVIASKVTAMADEPSVKGWSAANPDAQPSLLTLPYPRSRLDDDLRGA